MKKLLFLLAALFLFGSCCEPKGKAKKEKSDKVKTEQSK